MLLRAFTFVLSVMLLPSIVWAQTEADQSEFWQALKEGGKVVLIRHAEIDRSVGDSFLLDESCFSEKNLNELGQNQAKAIGEAFRHNAIAVNQVFASPHCRTKDTAKLAFGDFKINPLLRLSKALTPEKASANQDKVRQLISSYQAEGNLILVTHRPNIGGLANIRVETAEMVIIEPLGDGLYDIVERLKLP